MKAFLKKASKTAYFIESSILEIVSSVLHNSSNNSNHWMKQFILVEEDVVDAYNGQINFLNKNDDLFKAIIKNMKQFNLAVCLLARGISCWACSSVLEHVAQESRGHIFGSTSPGDIGHIARQVVVVNLSAIAVILDITWAFCVSFDGATHNNEGTLMSGSLVVFMENYPIFICWLCQCKTLLILVQLISILWLKCWTCFTVGGNPNSMLLPVMDPLS
jgi:hypothetical protein